MADNACCKLDMYDKYTDSGSSALFNYTKQNPARRIKWTTANNNAKNLQIKKVC